MIPSSLSPQVPVFFNKDDGLQTVQSQVDVEDTKTNDEGDVVEPSFFIEGELSPTSTASGIEHVSSSKSMDSYTDCDSDESEDFIPGTFEGPEKNIEAIFKAGVGSPNGCRDLDRRTIDRILTAARCTIISCLSNDDVDAYVLSESSLFVYKHKMMLKTCGKITLLKCIQTLLSSAAAIGLELEWLGFSRKNYTFPEYQRAPHTSSADEFDYLKQVGALAGEGEGHVLGPVTGDHFIAYVVDRAVTPAPPKRIFNLMMFELDPAVAANYFQAACPTLEEMTAKGGIQALAPGAKLDAHSFEPCGYSMNAIDGPTYYTMHITPEAQCSYASYETNAPLTSYADTLARVLAAFRPGRFTVTMIANESGLDEMVESPFASAVLEPKGCGRYIRTARSVTGVGIDGSVLLGNWKLFSPPVSSNM